MGNDEYIDNLEAENKRLRSDLLFCKQNTLRMIEAEIGGMFKTEDRTRHTIHNSALNKVLEKIRSFDTT